jgi:hypothetical protein
MLLWRRRPCLPLSMWHLTLGRSSGCFVRTRPVDHLTSDIVLLFYEKSTTRRYLNPCMDILSCWNRRSTENHENKKVSFHFRVPTPIFIFVKSTGWKWLIYNWSCTGQQPVRSAYQPPASSTFLSERTSHQQPAATSQQYSSLRTNQHQPSATSHQPTEQAASWTKLLLRFEKLTLKLPRSFQLI